MQLYLRLPWSVWWKRETTWEKGFLLVWHWHVVWAFLFPPFIFTKFCILDGRNLRILYILISAEPLPGVTLYTVGEYKVKYAATPWGSNIFYTFHWRHVFLWNYKSASLLIFWLSSEKFCHGVCNSRHFKSFHVMVVKSAVFKDSSTACSGVSSTCLKHVLKLKLAFKCAHLGLKYIVERSLITLRKYLEIREP